MHISFSVLNRKLNERPQICKRRSERKGKEKEEVEEEEERMKGKRKMY